jgi:hypothetical protein
MFPLSIPLFFLLIKQQSMMIFLMHFFLSSKTLLRTKPVYRLHVDTVSSNRVDLANSFVDGKQFETPYIEIFGHCLRLDDNELYLNCSGYRVMLPVTLSVRFSGSNPVISSNGQQL